MNSAILPYPKPRPAGRSAAANRPPAAGRAVELARSLLGEAACRQLGIYPIPPGFKLSVVIPVYNEQAVAARGGPPRAGGADPEGNHLVDDCSTDGTRDMLRELEGDDDLRDPVPAGQPGQGAAVRAGFEHATGDVVLVQDADLEYDPAEYPRLIQPILDGRADVVFGSRFIGEQHRVLYFWHSSPTAC